MESDDEDNELPQHVPMRHAETHDAFHEIEKLMHESHDLYTKTVDNLMKRKHPFGEEEGN